MEMNITTKSNGEDSRPTSRSCLSARHVLALLAFLGFFNVYCMRVNLSVALVAMVNSSTADSSNVNDDCPDSDDSSDNNSTSVATTSTGEFDWDENTQALVLGAFFYGYTVTQIPGGWMAERIGGKKLFGFGCLCTALLTLLTPLAARAGVPYLVTLRILEGMGEGVTAPSVHAMWAVWAPLYERSTLAAFSFSGSHLGTVFAMPISGVLCQHGFAGGWPAVFYVFGALGCAWFVLWMVMVHDSPGQHPRISHNERQYIESSVGQRKRMPTPWRKIFTSAPMWGIIIAHFSNNWGFYSMLTSLPTYMKNILHFQLTQNGFLSGLPYVVLWLTQMTSGMIADFLRGRRYFTTGTTRKILNTVGLLCPGCLLIATGYTGCNNVLAVVLLTLGVGGGGFTMGGYNVNHLDIAPEFAGTLLGITNGIATIPGFLGPAVVGVLTNENQTVGQWRKFFFITGGVYLAGLISFLVLAEGEEQSWAQASPYCLYTAVSQECVFSMQQRPMLEDAKPDMSNFSDSSSTSSELDLTSQNDIGRENPAFSDDCVVTSS